MIASTTGGERIGFRHAIAVATSCLVWLCGVTVAAAQPENPEISARRAAERTAFSDDELKDSFYKTALGAKLQFDRADKRIRKFDAPVRVFVTGDAAQARADIARVVTDIQGRVAHLDVAVTDDRAAANVVVTLVRKNELATTLSRYGAARAKQIQQKLNPECLSGVGVDKEFHIKRAEVFLPLDAGEFRLYDCAYEELLQVLGVVNDDRSVPWTMFNDDVQMGFFDVYDQHLVNILYDPRVRPGMSRREVEGVMPEVLPAVRTWVARVNPEKQVKAGLTTTDVSAERSFNAACNCSAADRAVAALR